MAMTRVCVAALLLVAATLVSAQDNQLSIECPIPGNPVEATEEDCALYSACEFTDRACHMKGNKAAGYVFATEPEDTGRGFQATLAKADAANTMFGADIQELLYEVIYHEDYHVQIRLSDPNNPRYEVPIPVNVPETPGTSPLYEVPLNAVGDSFVLKVNRLSNGNALYKQVGPLTFEDQFIQLSVGLDSPFLYGLGENPHPTLARTFEPRTTYPMFATDQPIGLTESTHYGSYPYFVSVEDDEGNTHSVLLRNSNAMEYSTFTMTDGSPALTLRSVGGIIDLHLFAGPTPEEVNTQYSQFIGKPVLPPYWSLGFTLSRWGYGNTENVRALRERTRAAGIPQDVQMFDIDYMNGKLDFTFDPENFADLPELVAELRSENIRTVVILDPAIAIPDETYPSFEAGVTADAFIKWPSEDMVPSDQPEEALDYVVGNVWPSYPTVFPDFFRAETKAWWTNEISLFREKIPFDGIWVDMNEPANFATNSVGSLTCPVNALDDPPYPTKSTSQLSNTSGRLSDKTICMVSAQTDGVENYSHYDVHNLYGYTESVATSEALSTVLPGLRPFVLSRSTFPGSGKYAIHWLGDNSATWEQMALSVIGMIEFNMFGIPMVGADICGFIGTPSEEMCARWMQLGAFYPFSRNHNNIASPDQDPAMWPSVAEISVKYLTLRYKYIPYLYTLMHDAHMHGHSVVRPLFNEFPSDIGARTVSDQFLLGSGIMVAPVLEEGATQRNVYFPEGLWYGLESEVLEVSDGPSSQVVSAPLENIPVYIRGGSVLPFQEPGLTTEESRSNDFGLVVALDVNRFANGEVFWDDGVSEHVMADTYLANVLMAQDELILTVKYNREAAAGINLATIRFLGFPATPDGIAVNGALVDTYDYDEIRQILVLTTNVPLSDDLHLLLNYQNP